MANRGSVRADAVRTALALRSVIDETRRLFYTIGRAAERLHEADGLSGGERAVLVEVAEDGPRTVPAMAGRRPVSRQHIQSIVNALVVRGLIELIENPRHRRSKLVRITPAGREVVKRIQSREGRVIAAVVPHLAATDLEVTARTLVEIGRQFHAHIRQLAGTGGDEPLGDEAWGTDVGRPPLERPDER